MYVVTPALFFISVIVLSLGVFFYNPLLFVIIFLVLSMVVFLWRRNLISAFVLNQVYLTFGLLNLGKDVRVWESTSDKKKNSS